MLCGNVIVSRVQNPIDINFGFLKELWGVVKVNYWCEDELGIIEVIQKVGRRERLIFLLGSSLERGN